MLLKTPQEIRRKYITNPDAHGLRQNPAVVGHAGRLGIEDGHAHGNQPEQAQQIEPMKPADAGVPDGVGFQICATTKAKMINANVPVPITTAPVLSGSRQLLWLIEHST